jgi:hypothetical protein
VYGFCIGGNSCEQNSPLTDLAAFVIVLMRTRASRTRRWESNIPNILDVVTRDAATYFSVIFSSHFLYVLMLMIVRVRIRNAFWVRLSSSISPSSRHYGTCPLCKFRLHMVLLAFFDVLLSCVLQWKCDVSLKPMLDRSWL